MVETTVAMNAGLAAVQGTGSNTSVGNGQSSPLNSAMHLNGENKDSATSLARSAFADTGVRPERGDPTQGGASFLNRLDALDRKFLDSIGKIPEVDLEKASTPVGMMQLSQQLLEHQASLTRASIGISMVSSGTTSFRDGVKQVLSNS